MKICAAGKSCGMATLDAMQKFLVVVHRTEGARIGGFWIQGLNFLSHRMIGRD